MFKELMRPLLALALAVLAGACASNPAAPTAVEAPAPVEELREAAPRPFDVATSDGSPVPPWARGTALEYWDALQVCTGFHRAPAGLLVLHPGVVFDNGYGFYGSDGSPMGGEYLHATQEVHVVNDRKWTKTWRHEQLHLLLDLEGQDSVDHKSPLFAKCS